MAKRIKIDFTKTEESSGWNTRQIPEGLYKAKIFSVQETEAQDGTAMLVYGFVPTDTRFKSRRFPFYCKLQQNQLWKLRDLLVAAGEVVPKKAIQIDPEKIVGKTIAIEVEDDSYNGNVRSSVSSTYGLDILDEDGDDVQGDEEDEEFDYEEYDEDLDEEDEGEYEDYEEDDEEDDVEEEDEEDEEELPEDDDEEYEEEDEEEEPAPAPKRRPAKPAPKPVAKASPARRTVQRRR